MRQLIDERGLTDEIEVDSAGTGAWHIGNPPDSRATEAAAKRGIELTGSARQVTRDDFSEFDLIVVMDSDNQQNLLHLGDPSKVKLLREYADGEELAVPDPFYGGDDGFVDVLDIVERNCVALLKEVNPG